MIARIVTVEFDPPVCRGARLVERRAPMRGSRIAADGGPGTGSVDRGPSAFAWNRQIPEQLKVLKGYPQGWPGALHGRWSVL